MISAMTMGWGRAAGVLLAASVVLATAGCGGSADADGKASPSKSPAPSVVKAREAYEDDLDSLTWGGCPDDCSKDLNEVVANARTLRKAMNADSAGPEFWSPAYKLIDQIEEGRAKVEGDAEWNRALILKPAHELKDWLTSHPSS